MGCTHSITVRPSTIAGGSLGSSNGSKKGGDSTSAGGSALTVKDDYQVEMAGVKLRVNAKSPRVRMDVFSGADKSTWRSIVGDSVDYKLKFCYISQRGYYPNAMGKANQDSYAICEEFMGDKNTHFFGIFDGHGDFGDLCSHYAAHMVPKALAEEIKAAGGMDVLDTPDAEDVTSRALVAVNESLRRSAVDDSLSGTTCISVLLRKDMLLVANVGDSRAIIASDFGDKVRYSPLSCDQTPYRPDERERVKECGACVLTVQVRSIPRPLSRPMPWHKPLFRPLSRPLSKPLSRPLS